MFRRILVGDNERVLLIRNKRFERILAPGRYWVFLAGVTLERYDIKPVVFTSDWANYIVNQRPELASLYFTVVETGDSEVALVYFDGKLNRVIGPSKRVLFWRGAVN